MTANPSTSSEPTPPESWPESTSLESIAPPLFPAPQECRFLRGALRVEDFPPPNLPEVAFVGRSNVGKSSLINRLLGRKNLAHTSKNPGKTAQINFFDIAGQFVLVDMPGYGYATVSHAMQRLWGGLIPQYFKQRPTLTHVFVLIDGRHPPKEADYNVIKFLQGESFPCSLILTKTDKIPASILEARLQHLGGLVGGVGRPTVDILPFSVKNPPFLQALRRHVLSVIA